MNDEIILTRQEGVATITLNRPQQHNAFNQQVIQKLTETLKIIQSDDSIDVIILRGEGKSFSAGADLAWMKEMANYSHKENLSDANALAELLHTLATTKQPTITLAKGHTMGGGLGLLACSDIVIAADNAQFCFSETKLGLVPATIAPYVVKAIGARTANYLFLTATSFSAIQALEFRLVQQLVNTEALDITGLELAQQLRNNGPQALQSSKRLIAEIVTIDPILRTQTAELIATIRASEEAQEGLAAFFEKRRPNWR